MKRLSLIACAAMLGLVATLPAKADISIVRWNGSQLCQIWDGSIGSPMPLPPDYTVVAAGLPTWDAALAALSTLYADKKCGW